MDVYLYTQDTPRIPYTQNTLNSYIFGCILAPSPRIPKSFDGVFGMYTSRL